MNLRRASLALCLCLACLPDGPGVARAQSAPASQNAAATDHISRVWAMLPLPRVSVARTAQPPTIDGKLDDGCWSRAATVGGFTRVSTSPGMAIWGVDHAQATTTVHITHDDTALYVAFVATEPAMGTLVSNHRQRDANVWLDDCVELFLDLTGDGQTVVQIVVSCENVIWDAHAGMGGLRWNAEGMRTEVSHHDDHWIAELALPFADLGVEVPQTGDVWRVNFARERYAAARTGLRENSTWAGQPESAFRSPDRFGEMRFDSLRLENATIPPLHLGVATSAIGIANDGDRPRTLKASLAFSSGEAKADWFTINAPPRSSNRHVFDFTISEEGTGLAAVIVRDGDDVVAVVRRAYHIAPLLAEATDHIASLQRRIDRAGTGSAITARLVAARDGLLAWQRQTEQLRAKLISQPVNEEGAASWSDADASLRKLIDAIPDPPIPISPWF